MIFIETKLKFLMLQKAISSNYNQNLKKKIEKLGKKTTKIGLVYVQFYKTKLHRG